MDGWVPRKSSAVVLRNFKANKLQKKVRNTWQKDFFGDEDIRMQARLVVDLRHDVDGIKK